VISHAHNVAQKIWLPNLQKVRIVEENGRHRRIRICTRCLRSGKVQKAASESAPGTVLSSSMSR